MAISPNWSILLGKQWAGIAANNRQFLSNFRKCSFIGENGGIQNFGRMAQNFGQIPQILAKIILKIS
jgi:hypothetical protein